MVWLLGYGGEGVERGGLNSNGSHSLMGLNACSIGNDTIGRCGLVGESVSLSVYMSMLKLCPVRHTIFFLLPVNQDIEFPGIMFACTLSCFLP